jgi:hypothetical protein
VRSDFGLRSFKTSKVQIGGGAQQAADGSNNRTEQNCIERTEGTQGEMELKPSRH